MKNTIAIRREDLSKRGEKRVAITPDFAKVIVAQGHELIVQPGVHPTDGAVKRAFKDADYEAAGARISEEISAAKVVFGLKEIGIDYIYPEKAYLCFSHTHKGQIKNRKMLKAFKDRRTTLIDYELVTTAEGPRVITAFTYFAGYAGMIDTLWTVGKRMAMADHPNPFEKVPQSMEKEDLGLIKAILAEIGAEIKTNGTPASLPPFISVILGEGKTSKGCQDIYGILPVEEISVADLPRIFAEGSRKKVYQCVLGITDMFRIHPDATPHAAVYDQWPKNEQEKVYFEHPEAFVSKLEGVLPYASILMNCIIWSPEFPRTISRELMRAQWTKDRNLYAIGDITCDPNGSIEFSKETWIDNPVYIYDPESMEMTDGFEGDGVAVMAVTNLPCEFSADASTQFSTDMSHLIEGIVSANYDGSLAESGLPAEIARAVILWNGEFTEEYRYMESYIPIAEDIS